MAVSTKKSPSVAEPAAVPLAPPSAARIRSLEEVSPAYAADVSQMRKLETDRDIARREGDAIAAEIGTASAPSEVRLDALELLGRAGRGREADLSAKHTALKAARRREAAANEAISLMAPTFDQDRLDAWRALMREVTPAWRERLTAHARDVVTASRSRTALLEFADAVERNSPVLAGGFGDYSFGALESRGHSGAVPLWISELISLGFLAADAPFLADLPLVARGPDGKTAVDRPRHDPMMNPPQPTKAGILATAGAALSRGAAAVVGAFAPASSAKSPADRGWDGQDAGQDDGAGVVGNPPPSKGPMKRIRVLREMATTSELYRVGDTPLWDASDAARMVKAGRAEWVTAAVPTAAVSAAPAVPATSGA